REMALTGNDDAFKYDIAFSFVREDEGLATQLNDHLRDRYRTFLYSRAQEQLVGTDGEQTFNSVFEKEARIVAVLLRPEWGHTPWGLRFPIGCPGHVSGTTLKGLDLTAQPHWKREFKTMVALRSRRRLPTGPRVYGAPKTSTRQRRRSSTAMRAWMG